MTALELRWLAGLVEGEGCFLVRKAKDRRYPAIQLEMTDEDIVRRAREVTGTGKVYGPYARKTGTQYKPSWYWHVVRTREALDLMWALFPFMGERRQIKILELLKEFEVRP
jgi:hypothetical protein